ncbi:MAG: 3-dehydroquinate synthase [Gemmatimonadota bacterium]
MVNRVRVDLTPQDQSYAILIEPGVLDRLHEVVPPAHTYAIIADSNVAPLYASRIEKQLRNARVLTFPAGEQHKNERTWSRLISDLLAAGAGRDTCIIAVGGGVTGDLAGFVAATYMRGIPVVQVPTTLLAMIDASIGGKTGIDVDAGKNLVGAFHQPHVVAIDPDVLRALPDAELRYGLAEAVKHGAIADADYGHWIAEARERLFARDPDTLERLIRRSAEIKARFVSGDVHEAGARAALNFGHTIAHALEHASNYTIPHGHAVSVGMIVEAVAGESAGVTEKGTAQQLERVLIALGLPAVPPKLDAAKVIAATRTDKKSRGGEQHYTLLARFGEVAQDSSGKWTRALPDDVVREALTRLSIM